MNSLLIGFFAALGGLLLGVLSDMVSEEMRTRLDRLPQGMVKLAVLRLPKATRDEKLHDWLADLEYFLHGEKAVPVTRLFKGMSFGFGLLFSVSKMRKQLEVLQEREEVEKERVRYTFDMAVRDVGGEINFESTVWGKIAPVSREFVSLVDLLEKERGVRSFSDEEIKILEYFRKMGRSKGEGSGIENQGDSS
ncbi:hypothetical protein [Nocardiopsis alba]|uniref:Uncharacterized protein n=1 Tax=Nocardiopsis alba TaxID=53437 RepID=A0A7K2ILH1_9ACTN|nr:hypothetical protein [Nocardiopsis alba]MYR30687.1 hypothetical protein [Nocardiopsis alba]MYR30757.1 hypothetical protein [Nocardiopsis alba]